MKLIINTANGSTEFFVLPCLVFKSHVLCFADNCGSNCLDFQENYLDWENLGIGRSLLFLAVQTVFFWIIVIFIESQIFIKLFYLIRPKIVVVPDQ